jgi:hypothetical protein
MPLPRALAENMAAKYGKQKLPYVFIAKDL